MITPGDITKSLLEHAEDELRANGKSAFPEPEELAAAILNAAIEAGLVSPPCHGIRHDGRLFMTGGMVRLWPGKPEMSHHEHWKGQTE